MFHLKECKVCLERQLLNKLALFIYITMFPHTLPRKRVRWNAVLLLCPFELH